MIGNGEDDELIEYLDDERALLQRWIEWVTQLDPDILIGWNVDQLSICACCKSGPRRMACHSPSVVAEHCRVWRQSQADRNHHFVLIPGRVVLDGIDTLRAATYNFPSFALDAVAGELLGRGKLIHDREHNRSALQGKGDTPSVCRR